MGISTVIVLFMVWHNNGGEDSQRFTTCQNLSIEVGENPQINLWEPRPSQEEFDQAIKDVQKPSTRTTSGYMVQHDVSRADGRTPRHSPSFQA